LVRPKAISGTIVSRKHVDRANSTIIGIKSLVFFSSSGDRLPFVVKEKSGSRSGWEIAGVGEGKRKKLQPREAVGACPGLVSWTSFCSSLAPVDRLAPQNVRCIRAARYRAGWNTIHAAELSTWTRLISQQGLYFQKRKIRKDR